MATQTTSASRGSAVMPPKYQPRCQMRASSLVRRKCVAGVVGAIEAAADVGVDEGVDPLRRRRRDGDADASRVRRQAVAGERDPVVAAIARLPQPAARAVRRRVDVPRWPPRLPERGVEHAGVARLESEVDGTGVGVRTEHLLPDAHHRRGSGRRRARHSGRRGGRARRRRRGRGRRDRRGCVRSADCRRARRGPRNGRRPTTCTSRCPARCPSACRLRRCRRRAPAGREGATAMAPIEPIGWPSKIGCQVRPASSVSQTPPLTLPK